MVDQDENEEGSNATETDRKMVQDSTRELTRSNWWGQQGRVWKDLWLGDTENFHTSKRGHVEWVGIYASHEGLTHFFSNNYIKLLLPKQICKPYLINLDEKWTNNASFVRFFWKKYENRESGRLKFASVSANEVRNQNL